MPAVYARSVGIVSRAGGASVELADGRVFTAAPSCGYDAGTMLELWTVGAQLVHARVLRHREYLAMERVLAAQAAIFKLDIGGGNADGE